MDNETQPEKPRRGRRPKSQTTVDSSKLKTIRLDDDLKELINKKNNPANLDALRVKLPPAVIEELNVNVLSLNQSGGTKIDPNAYVKYALEMANENLSDILRRHLTGK